MRRADFEPNQTVAPPSRRLSSGRPRPLRLRHPESSRSSDGAKRLHRAQSKDCNATTKKLHRKLATSWGVNKQVIIAIPLTNPCQRSTLSNMKKTPLMSLILLMTITIGLLVSSCGGGGSSALSLSITPSSASATTNVELEQFGGVTLQADLSNGQTPTNVQWSSSAPLVGVSFPVVGEPAGADVGCSLQGPSGAQITATITATSQGLTATAAVTCHWM
jgi:hypothetical protein